ncbi:MAG: hypothetical protein KKF41_03535 [Actinobacteria bacterium]|nr:hypothetical protein [Actinomycetota bacterium]MBU1945026.1 hypothetical protein [Actinomycetota bacterium]MBU2686638.1 hypothetical protein [Actinomycetota bacterium]
MDEPRPVAGEKGESMWKDPSVSNCLMIATYVVGGAGIALGIYGHTSGGGPKALHWSLPLVVGAVGIISCIRHSVFHVSDARRAGVEADPFFMIELGFAQGAIGLVALLAFFAEWGVAAEVSLMLAFALYLGLAFFIVLYKAIKKGFDGGLVFGLFMWGLQVVFMFWFAIAAWAAGI